MSALPPKADMCASTTDVRYGPEADIRSLAVDSDQRAVPSPVLGTTRRTVSPRTKWQERVLWRPRF